MKRTATRIASRRTRNYPSPRTVTLRPTAWHGRRCQSSLAVESSPSAPRTPFHPSIPSGSNLRVEESGDVSSSTPLEQYFKLVNTGILRGDEHQTRIITKLQRLHDELLEYTPPPIPESPASSSLFSRLFSPRQSEQIHLDNIPKGLYLYGDVGTGKTMLMDLFFNTLPSTITRKRRVHFHAFMIDVHKRVHAAKKAMGHHGGDPIDPVAKDLAKGAYILCFDEFQVTDIADAMILRRLMEKLLGYGVVFVMTSNRHPDDLYKNGIQRSSFVPAIELIKSQLEVTDLDSGTDYRRIPRALSKVYYHPLTEDNAREVNKIFHAMTSDDPSDPVVRNRPLSIWGRTLLVPESTSKVAKFKFMDLCGSPLSAADYLEVTKTFQTVFVLDIPKMGMDKKDLARRFITFIDACYESKTKLFVTSEVPVYQVFSDDPDGVEARPVSDHLRSVMDDLGLSDQHVGTISLFSGDEELFAFARACSRLIQMGSKEWQEGL